MSVAPLLEVWGINLKFIHKINIVTVFFRVILLVPFAKIGKGKRP